MTRPVPPDLKLLRGTARRDRLDGTAPEPIARLAERMHVVEPPPSSVKTERGVALWNELAERLLREEALTRDTLRQLERLVLLSESFWSGKATAALARQIDALEQALGVQHAPVDAGTPRARASRWAPLRDRALALDALDRQMHTRKTR